MLVCEFPNQANQLDRANATPSRHDVHVVNVPGGLSTQA